MQVSKDILFFSNFCDYSKEILNLLIRKNMKQAFMTVCVDTNKYKLPDFIDRVPLIYTRNGEVLYDETIVQYIEAVAPKEDDILPFSLQEPNGYSDQFSFLENTMDTGNKGYTMLGYEQRIMAPADDENKDNGKSRFDASLLDQYMQERDNDIKQLKKNMGPGDVRF